MKKPAASMETTFIQRIILSSVVMLSLTACNRSVETQSTVKAVQGVPTVFAGIYNEPLLQFYEIENGRPVIDPVTGQPKIRHTVKTSGFSTTMKLFADDGSQLGTALTVNTNATYSFFSNSLWTCSDAEKAAGRILPLAEHEVSGDADCYIEINTTGDSGFSMSVIGLPGGQGMTEFVNNSRPVLTDGMLRGPADGPASLSPLQRVNAAVDADFAYKAMTDIAAYFGQNNTSTSLERNTCLKNQRAIGWTDLQAHYYCQLPLVPVRTCYATKLVETSKLLQTGAFDLDSLTGTMCQVPSAELVNPFCIAYEACLKDHSYFSTHAEAASHQSQFFYIMFVKQGAKDFNIESENDVINKFYGVTDANPASPSFDGHKRPRRVLDTYPNWLPDQPRYNKIRAVQLEMQTKLGVAPGQ